MQQHEIEELVDLIGQYSKLKDKIDVMNLNEHPSAVWMVSWQEAGNKISFNLTIVQKIYLRQQMLKEWEDQKADLLERMKLTMKEME